MKKIASITILVCVVTVACAFANFQIRKESGVRFQDIRTDASKTWAAKPSQDRSFMVEMVEPSAGRSFCVEMVDPYYPTLHATDHVR